jgi:hypothetical protein
MRLDAGKVSMFYRDDESDITRAKEEPGGAGNRRRGVSWILASFGFLVVGLAGGTIMLAWMPDWVWPFPLTGFIGYILAFRRGMLLWNPNIDRSWRRYLWLDRDTAAEEGRPENGRGNDPSGEAGDLQVVRPEPSRPPRHELRVVRTSFFRVVSGSSAPAPFVFRDSFGPVTDFFRERGRT